uniref:Uncharacterized protein n=1 Tax=Oryza glumipatula TaxID=40148 RepID=A0A0D9ZHB9_9ORYZ
MFLPNEAEDVQVASTSVEKSVAKLMDGGTDNAARRAPGRELAGGGRSGVTKPLMYLPVEAEGVQVASSDVEMAWPS